MKTKRATRTWTYTAEVPADGSQDGSLEDRFMEAYTQGDGDVEDETEL